MSASLVPTLDRENAGAHLGTHDKHHLLGSQKKHGEDHCPIPEAEALHICSYVFFSCLLPLVAVRPTCGIRCLIQTLAAHFSSVSHVNP